MRLFRQFLFLFYRDTRESFYKSPISVKGSFQLGWISLSGVTQLSCDMTFLNSSSLKGRKTSLASLPACWEEFDHV